MRYLHALLLANTAAARGVGGAGQALAPLAQSLFDADRTQKRRLVGGACNATAQCGPTAIPCSSLQPASCDVVKALLQTCPECDGCCAPPPPSTSPSPPPPSASPPLPPPSTSPSPPQQRPNLPDLLLPLLAVFSLALLLALFRFRGCFRRLCARSTTPIRNVQQLVESTAAPGGVAMTAKAVTKS